jgi:hypothetical protein
VDLSGKPIQSFTDEVGEFFTVFVDVTQCLTHFVCSNTKASQQAAYLSHLCFVNRMTSRFDQMIVDQLVSGSSKKVG